MTIQPPATDTCPQCGTQLAPSMKACPMCARLVHAAALTQLAEVAADATNRGDPTAALVAWREALMLLPADSRQYQAIAAKITELGRQIPSSLIPSAPAADGKSRAAGIAASLGALGLVLWKLKTLALGLTKGTTLFSMLLSLGVYWTAWGWQFAAGIVASIYVHEMGHVIALHRLGFKATAPMFVPGLGALVRLQQQVVNPREDAEIGLAGPIYGLGAALVVLALWAATDQPMLAAIAGVGAWINLFNLLPIATLDGGRAFHAMSRPQKLLAAAVIVAAWFYSEDGLLILLALVACLRAIGDKPTAERNAKATIVYCVLIAALTALSTVRLYAGLPT